VTSGVILFGGKQREFECAVRNRVQSGTMRDLTSPSDPAALIEFPCYWMEPEPSAWLGWTRVILNGAAGGALCIRFLFAFNMNLYYYKLCRCICMKRIF